MSDQIWIVRDPSGKVIGASAIDAYCAADEFGGRDSVALSYAIDNQPGPRYTANGYTLTSEALAPAPRVVVTDTQRLDALERGDIEIESMGTTVRYFNVLSRTGRMVTASPVDANPLTLREAIDAALTEAPADA